MIHSFVDVAALFFIGLVSFAAGVQWKTNQINRGWEKFYNRAPGGRLRGLKQHLQDLKQDK